MSFQNRLSKKVNAYHKTLSKIYEILIYARLCGFPGWEREAGVSWARFERKLVFEVHEMGIVRADIKL